MSKTIDNQNNDINKRGFDKRNQMPVIPPKDQLNVISQYFLNATNGKYNEYEMEAKFGTRGIKRLTKIDYDNVVKKLKSLGYQSEQGSESYSLKIQPEFIDMRSGEIKTTDNLDNFRIEIDDFNAIQEYCKTNDLKNLNQANVKIQRKLDVRPNRESNESIQSANFDDFNFRVTLKNEETISKTSKIGMETLDNWNRTQKVFRFMKRVKFINPNNAWHEIHLSIVKSSNKNDKGRLIKSYNVDESNVFQNQESYEIEIEVQSTPAKILFKTPQQLSDALQKSVKNVLSGLQRTNYPISYPEQKKVIQDYLVLLFDEEFKKRGEKYVPKERVYPSDFIGPNSKALQRKNVGPINSELLDPNITAEYSYCVTDKADGERHMLYVNKDGRIYLINTNMNVIFTGAKTEEPKCFNSLLDGELILHNKNEVFINTYASFDLYYYNSVDIRARPFTKAPLVDEKYFEEGCRLNLLKEFIKILNPVSIVAKKNDEEEKKGKTGAFKLLAQYAKKTSSPIKIISKKFYPNFDTYIKDEPHFGTYNIFESCNYILTRIRDGLYDYNTDGLIFTPTLFGVGGTKFMEAGPKKKLTWDYSFKWKPSEATPTFPKSYNTIDFLVTTKKGPDGNDIETPIFENGFNVNESTQFNQYKTLILAVGFDLVKHGFANPCQDVLDDRFPNPKDVDNEDTYKPKQFYPSDPYDAMAGLCSVMLKMDNNGNYNMFTEEGEVFDDQTIVEFRYDMSKPGLWKWIPMRVRYDKTAEFRQGLNSFGNDYITANNNWYSIHNPVTERMIATGKDIPGIEISDDVYYNSVTKDKLTEGMRDFHNLFVKKLLIQGVSKRNDILLDFACGKGGDFPKWIGANLSFVFGIDISRDNIENKKNGACARFLNFKKSYKNMPYALFVNGNSALNIRSGTNMFSDKANAITKSVFGSSGKDKSLGPAVERQFGKGIHGFDVTSCQFAIHYMFENRRTFYNFIRNVAECTKLNGYFIATCYDGKTIFNMLNKKEQGEMKEIYSNDKKVWSVTKDYDANSFEDNDSSLGLKISVYQDSINQTIPEYLVNFDFLTSTMDKYGFQLVHRDEAKSLGLPEGSGMFIEMYNMMKNEISRDPRKEKDYGEAPYMKGYEKDISFLNRFFVFKKIAIRDVEKLTKIILEELPDEEALEQASTMLARESVKKAQEEMKPRAKKLGQKLKLIDATEALEEEGVEEPVSVPVTKAKKTTRKKKPQVDFDIVG
jgi:hypothetical protein